MPCLCVFKNVSISEHGFIKMKSWINESTATPVSACLLMLIWHIHTNAHEDNMREILKDIKTILLKCDPIQCERTK